MKRILIILAAALSTTAFAQHDKGNWFINASSSGFQYDSNTGSGRTIDIAFTEFKDTLVSESEFLNLSAVFPYDYKIDQDKNTNMDLNLRFGYTLADDFVFGLGLGYSSQSVLFKTNVDPDLAALNPTDSIMNVLFNALPASDVNGSSYLYHYYGVYNILTQENDFTITSSMLKIAPFVRYYYSLGSGSLFMDASYEMGSGKETIKDDVSFITTTSELKHSKINVGLGYALFVNDHFSIEPQFNYYMLDASSKMVEDGQPNPFVLTDTGVKTTEASRKSSGMNFSIGLSVYL